MTLAAILEALPDVIAQLDGAGRVIYANRSLAPGASWLSLIAQDDRDRAARALAQAIASRAPIELAVRRDDADGAALAMRIAPLAIAAGGAVVSLREVSAEPMRTFVHDLSNPLSVVIANLQLALGRIARSGETITLPAIALDELTDALECAALMQVLVADLDRRQTR